MHPRYFPQKIERKWQKFWTGKRLYKTKEKSSRDKFYVLDMFPYPSGDGLHVGHPKGYIATDIYSRFQRMKGKNVLHPMGWDAFGLPAENYALKNKIHPRVAIERNIKRFKKQLSLIGLDYDWSREINTTDPEYYKWTQWIFLQLFKKGLAYESDEPINWCPSCKTGLANEDLEQGKCERCGSRVKKKPLRQWVLRITQYADRMLEDLKDLDWPEPIKESQKNWIGRSEGAEIDFPLSGISGQEDSKHKATVFTTRSDTIFGTTFLAISPQLAQEWISLGWQASSQIRSFVAELIEQGIKKSLEEVPEKKGMFSGIYATNPVSGERIPLWIASYVLSGYGTGAIMAVPAHDERDWDFAVQYNLPRPRVISTSSHQETGNLPHTSEGYLVNSGKFTGLQSAKARLEITKAYGRSKVVYKIKDWVFSRQRYWGEPIPLIHCQKCGIVPLSEKDLPLKLPNVKHYEPTGTGESPLAKIESWVNVKCPRCKGPARRETNTMPQWAGSCWYYVRYIDPCNKKSLVDKRKEKYWMPVDLYVGGAEHATRHLIYARFWHKFLYDIGVVSTREPFVRLKNVGLIMGKDGRKMSKRYGNTVNPDEVIKKYGADTLRVYEMFMGPFDQSINWSSENMIGPRRFLDRVWQLQFRVGREGKAELESMVHGTVKKVTDDIVKFNFNTAIAATMVLVNALFSQPAVSKKNYKTLLLILAPFAPYLTEELWNRMGFGGSIHIQKWPSYDPALVRAQEVRLIVQVNGRVRDDIKVQVGVSEQEAREQALQSPRVQKWIEGRPIKKTIFIKDKLINLVV